MKRIALAAELIEVANLKTVKFYELAARSSEGFRVDEPQTPDVRPTPPPGAASATADQEGSTSTGFEETERQDWHLYTHSGSGTFGFRVRLEIERQGHSYVVDAAALYELTAPASLSEEAAVGFVEKVGFATLYPFVREAVIELAHKLDVEPPDLPSERPRAVERALGGALKAPRKQSDRSSDNGSERRAD
ncbi:hypothetical protein ACQPW3_02160 [Actinosynnema sp. CA-248983]